MRIFTEAATSCRRIREDALRLGERERSLIHIDRVKDIVGVQLTHLRNLLMRMGDRLGADANPVDPVLAKRVIDRDVDEIFTAMTEASRAIDDGLGHEPKDPVCSSANTEHQNKEQNNEGSSK